MLEDGSRTYSEEGVPQGGSVSPMLANVYLHYVFDLWVHKWRKTQAKGEVLVVRYADDLVMGFQYREEAEKFMMELEERLLKYGLEINHDKTRLIEFGRFAEANRKKKGEGKPETFDFLGFTHICSKNPKTGYFIIERRTIRSKMRRKIKEIKEELKKRMHTPVKETGKWLKSVIQGHFNYYGVPGNRSCLSKFRTELSGIWLKILRKRSQKGYKLTWEKFNKYLKKWIPPAKVTHLQPWQRLCVTTIGKSPVQ